MLFSKEKDIKKIIACLKNYAKDLVIITNGKHGVYAYNGQELFYEPSILVKNIVDTTGAGDCFGATFFYFHTNKYSIKESLKFAAINSASLIQEIGSQKNLLNKKQIFEKSKKFI